MVRHELSGHTHVSMVHFRLGSAVAISAVSSSDKWKAHPSGPEQDGCRKGVTNRRNSMIGDTKAASSEKLVQQVRIVSFWQEP